MSKYGQKFKSYKLPQAEKRPLSNKFVYDFKAGEASPGPPLGPLLGQYGVNIAGFCKTFNNKTSHFIKGLPLPVVVTINADRTFDFTFRKPHFAYYAMQAAGTDNTVKYKDICGKLTRKHIYEIAKIKHEDSNSYEQLEDLKDLCQKYFALAHKMGFEVVDEIHPEEYGVFLKEKKEYVAEVEKQAAAEKEAKLLRG